MRRNAAVLFLPLLVAVFVLFLGCAKQEEKIEQDLSISEPSLQIEKSIALAKVAKRFLEKDQNWKKTGGAGRTIFSTSRYQPLEEPHNAYELTEDGERIRINVIQYENVWNRSEKFWAAIVMNFAKDDMVQGAVASTPEDCLRKTREKFGFTGDMKLVRVLWH